MEKMTYVSALEKVLAVETLETEVREKLEALKASLVKRNSKTGERKPTKVQRENAEIKEKLVAFLQETGEKMRASTIAEAVGLSQQKASALLNQLVKEGALMKGEGEKRVTIFYAETETEEEA